MRQRELFDPTLLSRTVVPEVIEMELIELLAQLMLSTINSAPAPDEEQSDEPDQR